MHTHVRSRDSLSKPRPPLKNKRSHDLAAGKFVGEHAAMLIKFTVLARARGGFANSFAHVLAKKEPLSQCFFLERERESYKHEGIRHSAITNTSDARGGHYSSGPLSRLSDRPGKTRTCHFFYVWVRTRSGIVSVCARGAVAKSREDVVESERRRKVMAKKCARECEWRGLAREVFKSKS